MIVVKLAIKIWRRLRFQSCSRIESCFLQAEFRWLQKDHQVVHFILLIIVGHDLPILYFGLNGLKMQKN